MLSHRGWEEPHSLEELLRTVSEDVVTLKKNNHVIVSFKFNMVGYQRRNHPSTDFAIVDLKESAVASVGKKWKRNDSNEITLIPNKYRQCRKVCGMLGVCWFLSSCHLPVFCTLKNIQVASPGKIIVSENTYESQTQRIFTNTGISCCLAV